MTETAGAGISRIIVHVGRFTRQTFGFLAGPRQARHLAQACQLVLVLPFGLQGLWTADHIIKGQN
jgi:hypothetical protein